MSSLSSIDALVADLTPVAPVAPKRAWAIIAVTTLLAVAAILFGFGARPDIMAGEPQPMVLLRAGTLLLLGIAATGAVIAAARPAVGQSHHGWRWAAAAAALFPLTSMLMSFRQGGFPMSVMQAPSGPWCLALSTASALVIGGGLTAWLRTGAPTAINRAGWLTGLAAGAFGTFAYSLHCPSDTVHYIGLWYSGAIAISMALGRLIVPRLIRW